LLIDANLGEVKAEPEIIEAIEAFRAGRVVVVPGGGGMYGKVKLIRNTNDEKKEIAKKEYGNKKRQKSLLDF
jgi:PHP family Zn ribbon phosphoesterase